LQDVYLNNYTLVFLISERPLLAATGIQDKAYLALRFGCGHPKVAVSFRVH
jgi:hypothetical protein